VVSDIERVAAGLSQKIWQKIMILQSSTALTSAASAPQLETAAATASTVPTPPAT